MERSLRLEQYPTRNGIAISALELEFPSYELENIQDSDISNHHDCWYAKKFGNQLLYLTLRKLEICQSVLPNNLHEHIHCVYEQPKLPRPSQAFTYIVKAAEEGIRLKNGSANKPHFEPITNNLLEKVHENYKRLKTK